ncbi:MAG: hypothetical protein SFX72_01925 [Isosphaeraceae bacterium]|nr:hypothetical protein [Isosphaeraceae bacterium]
MNSAVRSDRSRTAASIARAAALLLLLIASSTILEAGTADALLRRVPPDTAGILVVEDLSSHLRTITASPAAAAFQRLPAAVAFRSSDAARKLNDVQTQLQAAFGASPAELIDKIFGDAVVLCLHVDDDQPIERASGLLLIQPRDPALAAKVVKVVNALQQAQGELVGIEEIRMGGRPIQVRKLAGKAGAREYQVAFDDGVFAWSNSESLIRAVVARSEPGAPRSGLLDQPDFRALREGLPSRAAISLFVSPRFLQRLLSLAPEPGSPEDRRIRDVLDRILTGLRAIGFAFEWRDGPLLHARQILDPGAAGERLRAWARRPIPDLASLPTLPARRLAFAWGSVDFVGIYRGMRSLFRGDEVRGLDLVETALDGILLGEDLESSVLPRLGPGIAAYLEPAAGSEAPRFDFTTMIELGGNDDQRLSRALENAARTLLAVAALDPKNRALGLEVETVDVGGKRIVRFAGNSPVVVALTSRTLIVSTSTEAVVRLAEPSSKSSVPPDFTPLRDRYFPKAQAFVVADLARFAEFARSHRQAISRQFSRPQEFDQAIALLDLFPTALAAVTVDPELASIHWVAGLVAARSGGADPR